MVGRRYGVGAQHRNPQRSAFHTNGENVDRLISLNSLRDLSQIGGQTLAVKFPHQHFRKSRLRSGTAGSSARPIAGVMNREGSFIQIALELKSRLPDEALIFGIMADKGQLFAGVHSS